MDFTNRGPLVLIGEFQSEHRVRSADKLAAVAAEAAASQEVGQLAELDALIADRFQPHRHAEVIAIMVGIGDLLGAR